MLDMGSKMLWHIWRNAGTLDLDHEATVVVRTSALAIVSMGLMYGKRGVQPAPTEIEFRLLCWEFHDLPELSDPDSTEAKAERAEAIAKLCELPLGSRLRRIDHAFAGQIRGLWLRGKVLERQLQHIGASVSDAVRAALLYEKLRAIMGGEANSHFRAVERAYLRTDYRLFLRATLVLLEYGERSHESGCTPGRVDLGASDSREEEPADVGLDDLLIATDLLGCRASQFRGYGEELLGMSDSKAKRSPLLWHVLARPILRLDDYSGPDVAISIPSPWGLMAGVSRALLTDFIGHMKLNGGELLRDPEGARGLAFDEYIENSLADLIDIRRVEPSAKRKRPDFCWLGETYGIAIEAKVRVTPSSDPSFSSIRSIIEAWHRLCEAIDQGASYVDEMRASHAKPPPPERWILIIVVQEADAAELTAFRYAVSRWQLLAGTAFSGLAVLTPRELEHAGQTQTADELGRLLERRYLDAALDPLEQPRSGIDFSDEKCTRYVEDGWTRLIGQKPEPRSPAP